MNRKLIFALVLLFAVGLAGCTGNVPASATIAPTLEPTATLPLTAVPTDVPTATLEPIAVPTEVPTEEPTLVPTEVPMYVGLPADEVNALREQCLQANPDSLCIPLPAEPVSSIERAEWGFGPFLDQFLIFDIAEGTEIVSPRDGQIIAWGSISDGSIRYIRPSRSVNGLQTVEFRWGPFTPTTLGAPTAPVMDVVLTKSCDSFRGGGWELLEASDISIFTGAGAVAAGQVLVQANVPLCVKISRYTVEAINWTDPVEGFTVSGTRAVSHGEISDLLTNELGSTVFILPIADADLLVFSVDEPRQELGSRTLTTGEAVVVISGPFRLRITEIPGYSWDSADLLRTDAGSIVYVLDQSRPSP